MKQYFHLFIILLLAAILRFWQLGENPPALSWDEAAWGYNAYSLGLTGRDEFGRFLPLDYLESFGDFKPPVYVYLAILPVKIFGLNEFSTRFPSAFFGIFTVLASYFLVKEILFNQKIAMKVALLTSFLLAISPWHLLLSRGAFEANVASFFIIVGVTSFLTAVRKNRWFFVLSVIAFVLSLMTFNTARVVSPLLVFILGFAFRKKLWLEKKLVLMAVLIALLILWPTIRFLLTPQASLRFKEVNIFSDSMVVELANKQVANDNNQWWSKILHNRRLGYSLSFARHYLDHLNPAFLFIKGDGNPKFATGDVGQLYFWELPFLIIGCLWLLKFKPGYWWLVPIWLLVGILPSALARETPHGLRIETTLPTWQILVAYGLIVVTQKKRKIVLAGLVLVIVVNFVYFIHGYWRHYPLEAAKEWEYGYQPMFKYLLSVENNYDQIWFSDTLGRPYIFYLFYAQLSPHIFQTESEIEREVWGFVHVFKVAKYHFFGGKPLLAEIKGKSIIVNWFDQVPLGARILKEIYLFNGQRTLVAYEI